MILSCQNIEKAFLEKQVLKNCSFHIEDYEKAAIVGLNGAGKTTLLRIIVGQLEPDGGVVAFAKDKTFGYLAQDSAVNSDNTIYEELLSVKQHLLDLENQIRQAELSMKQLSGDALENLMQKYADLTHRFEMENGYAYKSELTGVLKGLGFTEDEFQKPVSTLSGGQKTRVALGKLLLQKPDLIILDEPTNHLDMRTINWLARHLKARWQRGQGAMLVVTHDRWFLDEVCTSMWEVHDGQVDPFEGGYSAYILQRVERDRMAAVTEERRRNMARKELAWLSRGAQARSTKPKFRVDAARELIADVPPVRDELELKRLAVSRLGKQVIDVVDVDAGYADTDGASKQVLTDVTWLIGAGDRYGLLGENGAGKSTLLDVIQGKIEPTRGRVKIGQTVRFGVLSQQLEELKPYMGDTIREVLGNYKKYYVIDGKETSPEKLCERLGFTTQQLWSRIGDLSGGQRRRLSLLLTILDEPNVLILDEPGNDLDTDMLAIVEDLLDGWPGTLILVTHDRFLMERVTDQQWALLDGHLTHMPGGVDQYLRLCNATAEGEPVGAPSAKTGTFDTGAAAAAAEKPKSSGQPNGLSNAERQKLRREVSSLERKMETQRTRVEEAEAAMAQVDPTNYTALGEQQAKIDEAHAAMDELEMTWLEASEKLEGEE
ncbi:ABC-F family ATP-binding cassette domain-containing protein [Hominenteromicrobium sp.]|uniref:ABC-F family ATP-binding cassette domain-containing protein n=1 Tax=Hominenteromicrobium sp. TaxID=3073581 RepID=UPI003AF0D3DD